MSDFVIRIFKCNEILMHFPPKLLGNLGIYLVVAPEMLIRYITRLQKAVRIHAIR